MNHTEAKTALSAIARDMETSSAGYVRRQGRRVQEALDALMAPDMDRLKRQLDEARVAFEAGFRAAERGDNLDAAWRRIMIGPLPELGTVQTMAPRPFWPATPDPKPRPSHAAPVRNRFVDLDGRTYRVAFHGTRPLIAIRRDHTGHDTGPALKLDGALARRIIKKAREI